MNHPGNQVFRALVKASVQHYSDSHSYMKGQIKESIVQQIEAKGGRFLKKTNDGSGWCILSHVDAVEKTSQALRDAKRLREKQDDMITPMPLSSLAHQHDDPMQSMTMTASLEPMLRLDVPVGVDPSTRKPMEQGPSSFDDSEDVTMLSSMFAVLMSREGMAMDDSNLMMPPPSSVSATKSTTPNNSDVLCGSGKAVMNHPGNIDFRRMVKTMVTCFSDAQGYMKTQVSDSIVQSIEGSGGRFLKQNAEGVWCPISHAEAVEKTSQALRDAKRLTLRQKGSQDHTPTDSPKRDIVVSSSAPLSSVSYFPPAPPSMMKIYNNTTAAAAATVAETTNSGDVAMLSFGPSIDDPSSVLTFDISGNMDSVESLDHVYGSKTFDAFDRL